MRRGRSEGLQLRFAASSFASVKKPKKYAIREVPSWPIVVPRRPSDDEVSRTGYVQFSKRG